MKSTLFLVLLATSSFLGFRSNCSTFELDDYSTPSLGDVTISGTSGSTTVRVSGSGTYQAQVCFVPISITINSQIVPYPLSQVVLTASGKKVSVSWPSTGAAEIYDYETVNSPAQ
jgi:hypothetical protein